MNRPCIVNFCKVISTRQGITQASGFPVWLRILRILTKRPRGDMGHALWGGARRQRATSSDLPKGKRRKGSQGVFYFVQMSFFIFLFATFTSKTHIYAACVSALHAVHCASLVHRGALFLQPICKFSTAFRYWQRWLLGVHPLNWSERTRAAPQPRLPLTT